MILEKTIKVKELPATLRAGADPDSTVLVSVRSITENGFTEDFEQSVLKAEKEAATSKAVPIEDFIKELKSEAKK